MLLLSKPAQSAAASKTACDEATQANRGLERHHRSMSSFALPIALFCSVLVVLASPYGPRLSPDSGGYIMLATEAYRKGPLSISMDWWPPGLPWMLWLLMKAFGPDALFAGLLVNSMSIGVCCFVLSHGTLEFLRSKRVFPTKHETLLSVLLSGFLSLVLVSSTMHSSIAIHVWSEPPFLACISLGLWFFTRPGKHGWAWLFCAASCSIRFVGAFSVPIVCYHLLMRNGRKRFRETLLSSPAVVAATFVILSVGLFVTYSSLWRDRGNLKARKPFLQCLVDFFETLLGLFSPSGTELSLRTFLALGVAGLLMLGIGVWLRLKQEAPDGTSSSVSWGDETLWVLWIVVYSVGVSYLMARDGIGEMHRFVTPVITAFLWVAARWILSFPLERVRNEMLVCVVFLLSLSVKSAFQMSIKSFQEESRSHVLISGPHVRATREFKETEYIANQAQAIYFLGVKESSKRWAQIFSGLFNCHRIYFSTVGEMPHRFDFHEPTLVVSDTGEVPFVDYLRKQNALLFEGVKLGFYLWYVKPTTALANLPVEPFSGGCE